MDIIVGNIASWVGSIATALTLFWLAGSQIKESKERRQKVKKHQANNIFAWIEDYNEGAYRIIVNNTSNQPVYQIVICISDFNRTHLILQPSFLLSIVPPGRSYVLGKSGGSGMHSTPGIEFAFKDINGIYWIRKVNGKLISPPTTVIDYYNLDPPLAWENPMKVSDNYYVSKK